MLLVLRYHQRIGPSLWRSVTSSMRPKRGTLSDSESSLELIRMFLCCRDVAVLEPNNNFITHVLYRCTIDEVVDADSMMVPLFYLLKTQRCC